jgi:hypothetical protein
MLEHFFYKTSVRKNPPETLEFLIKLTKNAILVESQRSEASQVVEWVADWSKQFVTEI